MNMHAKVIRNKQMVWDDETKQRMANMWNDDESASTIATRFGTSRLSVIGIANRNPKLFKSKKNAPKTGKRRKAAPKIQGEPRAKPTHSHVGNNIKNIHKARMEAAKREAGEFADGTAELLKIAPSDAERLATGKELMDLGLHQCRWPLNNGSPFLFCADATDGAVYCAHHAKRSYQPRVGA